MDIEAYIRKIQHEVREQTQLIQYMKAYQVPFTRMDFLIEKLRDLKIKAAEVEALIALEQLRQTNQN